jgi:transposase-like protein
MSAARCVAPSVAPSAFAGFRFLPEVITLAVRWYLCFGLSYRDVEELLAERGINVDQLMPCSYATAHGQRAASDAGQDSG